MLSLSATAVALPRFLRADEYKPTAANLAAREAFQDAKFGMFIHWGVYSVLGKGEWVMNNDKIAVSDYEKLPPQFNPTEFNAAEWVSLAKAAGMKYITMAQKIKESLDAELGFTFSVGLAPNKVIAKLASKWKKPSGTGAVAS